jgi:hypothetical protein
MWGGANGVPRWESELWSYISRGDGVRCPMYERCRTRRECNWCISDNQEQIEQLLDTEEFDPRDYEFLEQITPGRIFQLVESLAHSFLRRGGVRCPPVPEKLVSMANDNHPIEVRLVPLSAHHGAIWRLSDAWVIQLNQHDPPARRRHTLFHEAFHIMAHSRASPVFRKRGAEAGAFNELLAEYFAACVLMPREWVKGSWPEIKDVRRMAEVFGVTEQLVWIRLKMLHLAEGLPPPSV